MRSHKDNKHEEQERKNSTSTVVIERICDERGAVLISDGSNGVGDDLEKKKDGCNEDASLLSKKGSNLTTRTSDVVYRIKINGVYPDMTQECKKKNSNVENDSSKVEEETKLIDEIKKEALGSFLNIKFDLMEQYLEIRSQLLKGQKGIRVMSIIATINILLMGVLNILMGIVSFNFLTLFTSIYITLIASVILLQEISRKRKISNIQILLRTWFKFLELSTGRGTIQLLLSTLTFGLTNSLYMSLISIFVGFVGLLNISFGVLAAQKMSKIINLMRYYRSQDMENLKLQDSVKDSVNTNLNDNKNAISNGIEKENDPEYKLKLIHRLFDLLDEDGNGNLDKEEFSRGFSNLRLPFEFSKNEIDIIFDNLDRDHSGQVSVKEFEYWFISNKCPYFVF